MVFSSFTFIFVFLPLMFGGYYLINNRTYRNLILFLGSLIFYAWGEPIYVVLMLLSTLNDFLHAKAIDKAKRVGVKKRAKYFLISSIVINLFVLFFFKYSDFLIMNFNNMLNMNIELLQLPLPIGISFYTFQTMSYTIDVYKGNVKVQKNILSLATYVTLFPQLIAGPIVRYKTIEEELNHRNESLNDFYFGLRRFIVGLSKKILISNQIGLLATQIQALPEKELSFVISWIGIIAYALHIYFDFSGYSDMAIGLGRMFGFHFLENFNYPYISRSITEFWRRWHISLGTWFKDYVYIPLGGNRGGKINHMRNILIVWALTGFWHGASWNFILWGVYFAIILIGEKYFLLKLLDKINPIFQHLYAIIIFLIGWVIFSFTDLSQMNIYLKSLFNVSNFVNMEVFEMLGVQSYLPYFFISILGATPIIKILSIHLVSKSFVWKVGMDLLVGVMFGLCVMNLLDATFNPFIYFRF